MKDLLVAVCVLDDDYSKRAKKIAAELGASLVEVQFPLFKEFCSGNRGECVLGLVEKILATKADMLLYQVHHTGIGQEIKNEILKRRVGMDLFTLSVGYEPYYHSSKVGVYLSGGVEKEALGVEKKALEKLEIAQKALKEAEAHLGDVRAQTAIARQRKEQRRPTS